MQTFEWNHSLGEIITALIQEAGLRLEFVHEHQTLDWQMLDHMERDERGEGREEGELGFGGWRLPPHQAPRCPLMFSLRATKPAASV